MTARRLQQLKKIDQPRKYRVRNVWLAHLRMRVPRKGSAKPAREKKSALLVTTL
jgi:hypothetical protein